MKVIIFGVGAIGSNLIDQLICIAPENEYYGVDYDKVEDRNVITQNYNNAQIGMSKCKAIISSLHLKHKKINYKPIEKKITSKEDILSILSSINFNIKEDLVIDCFDNIESRILLKKLETIACNILHVGFSPKLHAEVYWDKNYIVPKEDDNSSDICENPLAKPFILFTVSFVSMVIQDFLIRKDKINYVIYNKYNIQKV